MPTETSPQLYNLSVLEPLITAGNTILTPNYRLARRIKAEWDRLQIDRGLSTWQPVSVYPLQQWFQTQWEQAVENGSLAPNVALSAQQVKELWRQVIDADRQEHDQYGLLQSASAADLAQQARDSLLRWQVDWKAANTLSEFKLDSDCSTFLRWIQSFERELQQKSLLTEADYLTHLLTIQPLKTETVVLVDFDSLPPLHASLLEHLAQAVSSTTGAQGDAQLIVRSYPEHTIELHALAQWAAKSYKEQPERTLGLFLTDMQGDRVALEYYLRLEFDALGDNYTALPVNFSTAITLDQAPVVRDALLQLSSVNESLQLNEVVSLLRSQFSHLEDQYSAVAVKFIHRLYEDGAQRVDSGRLRNSAQTVTVGESKGLAIGDTLQAVAGLRLARLQQQPSSWVGSFCEVLDCWGWPGRGPLDSLEFQQVEQFYALLDEFAAHDVLFSSLDFKSALALLRRCCQAHVSQPKTKDSPIQVLGPLEGAGLHFDAIWVCGMQGSRWPAPAKPNPFIPVGIQRRLDMPHASSEREWAYADHLFTHYRAASRMLYASYARQVDGIPELASPLLNDFEAEHCEGDLQQSPSWLAQHNGAQLQAIDDALAPGIEVDELQTLSKGSGVLQDQANCPFRAFAGKRLRLETLGDYHAGLTAADRGSLLHNALFVLWGDLGDSAGLHQLDMNGRNAVIKRAAQIAIDEVPAKLRQLVGMACLELEKLRLENVLHEWLELELARAPFTVTAREAPLELTVGALSFNLRVDRIDTLATGESLVIDYKSGRNSLSDWLSERPAQPQLPLYAIATDVDALAFAQVKARQCKVLGLGEIDDVTGVQSDIEKAVKNYSSVSTWAQLKQEWQHNLQQLADAFVAGDARVDPLANACTYCGMQSLCRVEFNTAIEEEALL